MASISASQKRAKQHSAAKQEMESPIRHAQAGGNGLTGLQQTAGNQAVAYLLENPDGRPERPESPLNGISSNASDSSQPLPADTRSQFESYYHADFSQVRIHTGDQPARRARALKARAFTTRQHIYMNDGQYQPSTPRGQSLLAHELTHVVQQSGAAPGTVGSGQYAHAEAEARSASVGLNGGHAAAVLGLAPGSVPAGTVQREDEGEPAAEQQSWLGAAGSWALGAIGGEFIDEPTMGQIAVDMGLGLIPYVDQALDIRDLVANIWRLGFRGEHTSFLRWLSLVFTLIGAIPEVGTVIKSVSKVALRRAGDIMRGAGRLLEHLGPLLTRYGVDISRHADNMIGALRRMVGSLWDSVSSRAPVIWDAFLGALINKMETVGRWIAPIRRRIIDPILNVRRMSGEWIGRGLGRARQFFNDLLGELGDWIRSHLPGQRAAGNVLEETTETGASRAAGATTSAPSPTAATTSTPSAAAATPPASTAPSTASTTSVGAPSTTTSSPTSAPLSTTTVTPSTATAVATAAPTTGAPVRRRRAGEPARPARQTPQTVAGGPTPPRGPQPPSRGQGGGGQQPPRLGGATAEGGGSEFRYETFPEAPPGQIDRVRRPEGGSRRSGLSPDQSASPHPATAPRPEPAPPTGSTREEIGEVIQEQTGRADVTVEGRIADDVGEVLSVDELIARYADRLEQVQRHHSFFRYLLGGISRHRRIPGVPRHTRLVPIPTPQHEALHTLFDLTNPGLARGEGAAQRISEMLNRGEITPSEIADRLVEFYRFVNRESPDLIPGEMLDQILRVVASIRRRGNI